jgi:bacillithiol biosynthesis cysteine-adding enzyme BshC
VSSSDGYTVHWLPLEGHPILQDYPARYERVQRLFPTGRPDRTESFRRAVEAARARTPETTYAGLDAFLRPAGPAARRALERVATERGVVVATGQQPGLFTGPLYTIYKAVTAARYAAELEARLGVPAVASFWVASEDHDWEEANHTYVVNTENRLVRIEIGRGDAPGDGSPPLFRVRLGPDAEEAVAQLAEATPETEFKADVLDPLRRAYRAGAPAPRAFADALADLAAEWPLCWIDAADPELKRRSVPVLWREWERRRESAEALAAWSAELERAGYPPQVRLDPEATNLFVEGRAGRDRLLWDPNGGTGRLRRSGERWTGAALRDLLETEPERVSPNVLLRPVVEAAVLPTVAYVGGPAEVAYFAQLVPLFALHDLTPPVVVPRASARIVEGRIARVLAKVGLDPDELRAGADAVLRRRVREEMPPAVSRALADLRAGAARGLDALRAAVPEIDPSLAGAIGRADAQIEKAVRELEGKVTAALERRNRVLRDQIEKAAVHLAPLGQPQERVLNVYPYLVRYGRDVLRTLFEQLPVPLR